MYNRFLSSHYLLLLVSLLFVFNACSDSDNPVGEENQITKNYYLGIESATDPTTDVLTFAVPSLDEGTISPLSNGYEQPAWMTFIQGHGQIIVGGYTSAPEFTSYTLENGELVKGESVFTDLTSYAFEAVDENNLVLVASTRSGLAPKKIYHIDSQNMEIRKTVELDFGNLVSDSLIAFPTDVKVRDNLMFISYYFIHADGSFSTPKSNDARVAVFSYPEMALQNIRIDERASNIGRYYGANAIEMDENKNLYFSSPSSLACGYAPVPENPSAVLKIAAGASDFDPNYYLDFEAISGGYKLVDMFYVANGKAVVKALKEVETSADYLWAAYSPVSENPLIELGILDLEAKSFELLPNVPKSGGGWNTAHLVEDNKLYINVSNSSYAGIYVIDVDAGTATEGAVIEGNYVKGIHSLKAE